MIVLDASATAALLLPDENSETRERLYSALSSGAITPPHFRAEITSMILKAWRRGRLSPQARTEAIALAADVMEKIDSDFSPPFGSVLYLAEQHGLSAYDARYLWLAIEEGAPLLTTDGPLYRVARKLGVAA